MHLLNMDCDESSSGTVVQWRLLGGKYNTAGIVQTAKTRINNVRSPSKREILTCVNRCRIGDDPSCSAVKTDIRTPAREKTELTLFNPGRPPCVV